jgi:hypothetical protein
MGGHTAAMAGMRNAYKILVRKPKWNRALERSRLRWDDIKMDIKEME